MSNPGGCLKPLKIGETYLIDHTPGKARRTSRTRGTVIDETRRFYILKDSRGLTTTALKNDLHREAVKIEKISPDRCPSEINR